MISREEVENLAALARLELSDKEIEGLQADISNILTYVGQVSEVSAVHQGSTLIKPLLRNVMREDTPRTSEDPIAGKEEALRAAFPTREGDYNSVRKIIDKD